LANELMVEVARSRKSLNLPAMPREHETTPLLLPVRWRASGRVGAALQSPAPLTRAAVHGIVKAVFERAVQHVFAQGEHHASQAQRLRAASAHWLRHTAGSRMVDGVDLRHVRDTLRTNKRSLGTATSAGSVGFLTRCCGRWDSCDLAGAASPIAFPSAGTRSTASPRIARRK
jgi:hypothetical protein